MITKYMYKKEKSLVSTRNGILDTMLHIPYTCRSYVKMRNSETHVHTSLPSQYITQCIKTHSDINVFLLIKIFRLSFFLIHDTNGRILVFLICFCREINSMSKNEDITAITAKMATQRERTTAIRYSWLWSSSSTS